MVFGPNRVLELAKLVQSQPQVSAVFVNVPMLNGFQFYNLASRFNMPVFDRWGFRTFYNLCSSVAQGWPLADLTLEKFFLVKTRKLLLAISLDLEMRWKFSAFLARFVWLCTLGYNDVWHVVRHRCYFCVCTRSVNFEIIFFGHSCGCGPSRPPKSPDYTEAFLSTTSFKIPATPVDLGILESTVWDWIYLCISVLAVYSAQTVW